MLIVMHVLMLFMIHGIAIPLNKFKTFTFLSLWKDATPIGQQNLFHACTCLGGREANTQNSQLHMDPDYPHLLHMFTTCFIGYMMEQWPSFNSMDVNAHTLFCSLVLFCFL